MKSTKSTTIVKLTFFIGGFSVLAGCGAMVPPKPTSPAPVEIPKPNPSFVEDSPPEPAESAAPVKSRLQVVIGDEMVCLRFDGSLRCWKRMEGVQTPILASVPPIAGLGEVIDVSIGTSHVCAIVQGGQVYCWGDNSHGQLGARRVEAKIDSPVLVEGIQGATKIIAGMMHTCVLVADGRVSCWGWNAEGQTGSDVEYGGETRELVRPEIVAGISGATQIAAGRDQTCVQLKNESWCWGRSYTKSQSNKRGYHHNEAAKVEELADLQQFGFSGETACGLFKDGHVGCWGSGAFSILPSRPLHADSPLPVILPPAKTLAMSKYHGCAILQNGQVACWGHNNHGELGKKAETDYTAHDSMVIEGLPGRVDSLAVGSGTSCAILRKEELWCWGVAPHQRWVFGTGSEIPTRVPIEQ